MDYFRKAFQEAGKGDQEKKSSLKRIENHSEKLIKEIILSDSISAIKRSNLPNISSLGSISLSDELKTLFSDSKENAR